MKNKFVVFDNGGETLDRYTIIDKNGDMLGLSDNPTHPLGFSQFCGNCVDDVMFHEYGTSWRKHCDVSKVTKSKLKSIIADFAADGNIGKLIKFSSLSSDIKEHINQRFNTEEKI